MSENIVRYSAAEVAEQLRQGKDLSDWDRINAMTPEDIAAARASDTDVAPTPATDAEWDKAIVHITYPKQGDWLRVDPDIVDWFQQRGMDVWPDANTILRQYIQQHPTPPLHP